MSKIKFSTAIGALNTINPVKIDPNTGQLIRVNSALALKAGDVALNVFSLKHTIKSVFEDEIATLEAKNKEIETLKTKKDSCKNTKEKKEIIKEIERYEEDINQLLEQEKEINLVRGKINLTSVIDVLSSADLEALEFAIEFDGEG